MKLLVSDAKFKYSTTSKSSVYFLQALVSQENTFNDFYSLSEISPVPPGKVKLQIKKIKSICCSFFNVEDLIVFFWCFYNIMSTKFIEQHYSM